MGASCSVLLLGAVGRAAVWLGAACCMPHNLKCALPLDLALPLQLTSM